MIYSANFSDSEESTTTDYYSMDENLVHSIKDIAVAIQAVVNRTGNHDTSIRLDFSPFKGNTRNTGEVLAFITKLESCFAIKNWGTDHNVEKTGYFAKHLEGPALLWWASVRPSYEENPDATFTDIINDFKKYFIDPNYVALVKKKFFSLQQRSHSISGYVNYYRSIVNQLKNDYVSDEVKMDVFVNGLNDGVAGNVRSFGPTTSEEAITIALSFDNGKAGRIMNSHHKNGPPRNGPNNFNASQLGNGYAPMDIDNVETSRDYSSYKCYRCGKRGHIRAKCPQVKLDGNEGNGRREEHLKD